MFDSASAIATAMRPSTPRSFSRTDVETDGEVRRRIVRPLQLDPAIRVGAPGALGMHAVGLVHGESLALADVTDDRIARESDGSSSPSARPCLRCRGRPPGRRLAALAALSGARLTRNVGASRQRKLARDDGGQASAEADVGEQRGARLDFGLLDHVVPLRRR